MTNGAILRATAESGDAVDDPSEDALFTILQDIEAGGGTFLVVDSLTDASGQSYAQASRNDDGTYVVEYRDGGPDRHFATVAADMRSAHALLAGWAFGLSEWRASATWRSVSI